MASLGDQDIEARTALLLSRCISFCNAFLEGTPPPKILDEFFINTTDAAPEIKEHGPSWAQTLLPFLSRTFIGRDPSTTDPQAGTCDDYFRLLAQTLEFRVDQSGFPPPEEFAVDVDARGSSGDETENGSGRRGVVTVSGWGEFASVKTGKSWKEKFVHRWSGFDETGRIEKWEIWADPLSAWMAVSGVDTSNKS